MMERQDIYASLLKKNLKLLVSPDNIKPFNIPERNRVLVLAPHCDDEVIGCAGTILRLLEKSAVIKIVYITSEKGDKGIIRKNEAILAWQYLAVEQIFWEYPDGDLIHYLKEFEYQLEQLLYQFQPEMILLPWPIDSHKDHRSVFEAIYSINKKGRGVCELLFYENYYPVISNHLVDITSVYWKKDSMLKCFKSQDRLHIQEFTFHLNSYRAACIGIKKIKYAEAYAIFKF